MPQLNRRPAPCDLVDDDFIPDIRHLVQPVDVVDQSRNGIARQNVGVPVCAHAANPARAAQITANDAVRRQIFLFT